MPKLRPPQHLALHRVKELEADAEPQDLPQLCFRKAQLLRGPRLVSIVTACIPDDRDMCPGENSSVHREQCGTNRCECWPFLTSFLGNQHRCGKKPVRIDWKTPGELASHTTCLQGQPLGLAREPKLSRIEPCQKALQESGTGKAKASCSSASMSPPWHWLMVLAMP